MWGFDINPYAYSVRVLEMLEMPMSNQLSLLRWGYVVGICDQRKKLRRRMSTPTMNTQTGTSLPMENFDHNNFPSWDYKVNQYLVGQGYWGYIDEQAMSRVLYCLGTRVYDQMLYCI